jgi:hypothetical protein
MWRVPLDGEWQLAYFPQPKFSLHLLEFHDRWYTRSFDVPAQAEG